MKFLSANNLDADKIAFAVNSERTAQLAYGRAYFEFRDSQLTELCAILQLEHGFALRSLEISLAKQNVSLPRAHEQTGPFAADPRSVIFDLEPHLVLDYLYESENALLKFYSENQEYIANDDTALLTRFDAIKELEKALKRQHSYCDNDDQDRSVSAPQYAECG